MIHKKRNYLIHFDLDTNRLIEIFGEKSYRNAYTTIANFFYKNDIIHDQYSGYRTKYPIYKQDLLEILTNFSEKYPKITFCINRFSYSKLSRDYEISNNMKSVAKMSIESKNENIIKKIDKDKEIEI